MMIRLGGLLPVCGDSILRVLHVLNELKHSGAEVMLFTASGVWRRLGVTGDVLTAGIQRGDYAPRLEKAGYQLWLLPFSRTLGFILRVLRFFRDHREFDAVHIHAERASFIYALAAYLTGNRKILRTIHAAFPFEGPLRLNRGLQRRIMRTCLGVEMIAVSHSVAEREMEAFRNPTRVILNWFDEGHFIPPSSQQRTAARRVVGIPSDALAVVTVAGSNPLKNPSAVLEGFTSFAESEYVVLLWVGEPGDEVRRTASGLVGAGSVVFLGVLDDPLVALHAADVFLMPSLREGLAIAAGEAMGAGLPAILADVPGLRDFREICEGIIWIEPTAEAVSAALRKISDMPPQARRDLGVQLSRSARNAFPIERGARMYADLYMNRAL